MCVHVCIHVWFINEIRFHVFFSEVFKTSQGRLGLKFGSLKFENSKFENFKFEILKFDNLKMGEWVGRVG